MSFTGLTPSALPKSLNTAYDNTSVLHVIVANYTITTAELLKGVVTVQTGAVGDTLTLPVTLTMAKACNACNVGDYIDLDIKIFQAHVADSLTLTAGDASTTGNLGSLILASVKTTTGIGLYEFKCKIVFTAFTYVAGVMTVATAIIY